MVVECLPEARSAAMMSRMKSDLGGDSDMMRKIRREPRMDGRVESNGRLSPFPLLPLVKPDVRISRIRLSCKHSS
jgi:hypothetical protein